jgi:hypothetical protein
MAIFMTNWALAQESKLLSSYSLDLYAGYEGGSKGGILDIGYSDAANLGIGADFLVLDYTNYNRGFALFLGPRLNIMLGKDAQFRSIKSYALVELGLSTKPSYAFRLSRGVITPYVNIITALALGSPFALGVNIALLPAVRYDFNRHIGMFFETGFSYYYLQTNQGLFGYSQMFNGVANLGVVFSF